MSTDLIATMIFVEYGDCWCQGIRKIEVKEMETEIFILVQAPRLSDNCPTPVGQKLVLLLFIGIT
jgi:hypothetical protein